MIRSAWSRQVEHARITRSNETQSVEFDLVIRAYQRDMIRHFGSSFYYNDKFIIYPSNVIKNFEINILDQLYNDYLLKKKHIQKRTIVNFSMHTIFWVENNSKCIKKMRLCLEVGFVDFTLKRIKSFEQILYGAIWMTSQYLMNCVLRKTLCTISSVSARGDMD